MRKLLNTLFVTTETAYCTLDGENIVINVENNEIGRFPLHILEGIYIFSYAGASPALIGKCVHSNINICFMNQSGRFLFRATGMSSGNVFLRKEQYRISDNKDKSLLIARNMIFGKVSNARSVLRRTKRDHEHRINIYKFNSTDEKLKELLVNIRESDNIDKLRGFEGLSATIYFSCFDDMILQNKEYFYFHERSKRPPLDRVNAMLSFVYSILGAECAAGLEMVGLDAYVGFMHTDRPGRYSFALDLLEEFRACIADRFVITMINKRIISERDFEMQDSGAVLLNDVGRKKIQKEWQTHKQEEIEHPYLKEKIRWGLVPYVQAMLLSRCIRGDIEEYPPFLWR